MRKHARVRIRSSSVWPNVIVDRRIIVEPPTVLKKVSEQSSRVHSKRILPIGRIDKGIEIDLVWRQSSGGILQQAPSIVTVAHLMVEEVSSHGAQCARALIKLI